MYCFSCGAQIKDGSRFCSSCGINISDSSNMDFGNTSKRETAYAGKVIKCPSCGEEIPSFTAKCPTCGHELSSVDISESVQKFIDELNKFDAPVEVIEESTTPLSVWSDWSFWKKFWWIVLNCYTLFIPWIVRASKNDKQKTTKTVKYKKRSLEEKISFIKNYQFSNDRGTILDACCFIQSEISYLKHSDDYYEANQLILVWKIKLQQLHKKAEYLVGNDPQLDKIYSDTMSDINDFLHNDDSGAEIYDADNRTINANSSRNPQKTNKTKIIVICVVVLFCLYFISYVFQNMN